MRPAVDPARDPERDAAWARGQDLAGHLIFRTGPHRGGLGYLPVAPVPGAPCPSSPRRPRKPIRSELLFPIDVSPGTLWLFPGNLPHGVMAYRGDPGRHAARISVAINFEHALLPAPSAYMPT